MIFFFSAKPLNIKPSYKKYIQWVLRINIISLPFLIWLFFLKYSKSVEEKTKEEITTAKEKIIEQILESFEDLINQISENKENIVNCNEEYTQAIGSLVKDMKDKITPLLSDSKEGIKEEEMQKVFSNISNELGSKVEELLNKKRELSTTDSSSNTGHLRKGDNLISLLRKLEDKVKNITNKLSGEMDNNKKMILANLNNKPIQETYEISRKVEERIIEIKEMIMAENDLSFIPPTLHVSPILFATTDKKLDKDKKYKEIKEECDINRRNKKASFILLWGPPGTGKSSATHILACELNCDVYRAEVNSILEGGKNEKGRNTSKFIEFIFTKSFETRKDGVIVVIDECDSYLSLEGPEVVNNIFLTAAETVSVERYQRDKREFPYISFLFTTNKIPDDRCFRDNFLRRCCLKAFFPTPQSLREILEGILSTTYCSTYKGNHLDYPKITVSGNIYKFSTEVVNFLWSKERRCTRQLDNIFFIPIQTSDTDYKIISSFSSFCIKVFNDLNRIMFSSPEEFKKIMDLVKKMNDNNNINHNNKFIEEIINPIRRKHMTRRKDIKEEKKENEEEKILRKPVVESHYSSIEEENHPTLNSPKKLSSPNKHHQRSPSYTFSKDTVKY